MTDSNTATTGSQRKTYVLDTSVLLAHPNALHQFVEHRVVLPLAVVEELEAKRTHALLGYQAREALRAIDAVSEKGDIDTDVVINDFGGTVRVEMNHIDQGGLPPSFAVTKDNDKRILAAAFNYKREGEDVTVVSKDMPMRLKAKVLGLGAEQYRNEMVVVEKAYTGIVEVDVDQEVVQGLYAPKKSDRAALAMGDDLMEGLDALAALGDEAIEGIAIEDGPLLDDDGLPIITNTGVVLRGPSSKGLAIVTADKTLRRVEKVEAFGVTPRSVEQTVAMDHLLNPDIGIVSLGGPAGTGKTFTALAAALEQVVEKRTYRKVMIFRPLFAVGGQDLGYLPGSAEEKMAPWGAAITDALASMVDQNVIDHINRDDLLEVLPLTHIRGRSLNDVFVIVDEAQSLEKAVLLTAMSRLGENAKIALSHDVAQRDNMRVGRYDGIAAVVERLKGERLFAHVTMTKTERGPIAELVTRMLDDMVA